MIEKSRGKQYTYEFVMDITAILGYDPVGEIIESRNRNTNISKPGTAPSTVFRSIAADVAGSVGQMEEPRCTTEGCRGTGGGVILNRGGFSSSVCSHKGGIVGNRGRILGDRRREWVWGNRGGFQGN